MVRAPLLAATLTLLAAAVPAAARFGFPEPLTERARLIEDIYVQITVAGIIVFLFVFALLAFILYRYREGGKGRATYEKERDNLKAEMVWTIIPLIIMMWIGVISYQGLVELDNLDDSFDMENAIVIDITASQYAWQADYAQSGAKVLAVANDELLDITPFVVPADTPILFRITAVDVIHSFNVHALGTTIDAVPGQINELFVHDGLPPMAEPGYFTQCKEDCLTPGHSYMQARILSVSNEEFTQWTNDTLAGKGGLQQVLPIQYDGATLTAAKTNQMVLTATAHIQVLNNASEPMEFTFNDETIRVPSFALGTFTYPVNELGTFTLTSADGISIDLQAIEATTVEVDLGAFVIEPGSLTLNAGETYIIKVKNTHNLPHNLYIGMDGADGKTDAIWNTGDLSAGDVESIIITPGEASSLDMWCAVRGHYGGGMFGTVTVV